MASPSSPPPPTTQTLTPPPCHVSLTPNPLSITTTTALIRSPRAGALVIFAGTTRDNFHGRPVHSLSYTAYTTLALQTMMSVAESVRAKYELEGVAITHRLGEVPIGEESIVIAVSAAHREAAWRAGEEALEEVKRRVEVWKMEKFEDGEVDGEEGRMGVWRANRDGPVERVREEREKLGTMEG